MADKFRRIKMVLKKYFNFQEIKHRISKSFLVCLVVCLVSLMICFIYDLNLKVQEERKIGTQTEIESPYVTNEHEQDTVGLNSEEFRSMILTIDTILAAAVIFFYSIIDNRKTGISHRTIMTYTFGSLMVPGLFSMTIILLPIMYITSGMGMIATMWGCIAISYLLQIIIIFLILISTSYNYSLQAVCYAEIGQFEHMSIDLKNDKKKMLGQVRHMEQVVISDDLSVEKEKMISALLKVPFYKRRKLYRVGLETGKLLHLETEHLYKYYYMNVNSVFHQLKNEANECQMMYEILYVFIDELWEIFNKATENMSYEDEIFRQAEENYICVVAAILNAVAESGNIGAIKFADQVLQKQLDYNKKNSKLEIFNKQMGLYLCYLQFLFYVYEPSKNEYRIVNTDEWEPDILANIKYYEKYWKMWDKEITISSKESYFYFWNTISILKKETMDDSPICFVVNKKGERKYK